MTKVLLILPVPPRTHWPKGLFRVRTFDTRLACAATVVQRGGHQVRILQREEQLIKCGFDWEKADGALRRLLEEYRPDLVAQSVVTAAMPEAARIAQWARELAGARTLNVLCGTHPSGVPERTLAESEAVDAVALGEYECTLRDVADHGVSADVPGLVLRGDAVRGCETPAPRGGSAGPVRTPHREIVPEMDTLGPPAYDLLDMAFHTQPNPWTIRYLSLRSLNVRTSRGCPNRCAFCAEHLVGGHGVRFHSLDYVLDQVRGACDRWGVEAIHFEDETFGADRRRLLALCESIQRLGLPKRLRWDCLMRVDQVDAELLAAMKAAGCIQIEYGFESGSDGALRRVGKNATSEQNRRAVCLTREAGIRIFADIMVGLPGETWADLDETLRFLRWARPEILSAGRLLPMPGTALYQRLPEPVRTSLSWEGYSYTSRPGFRINFTALPDEPFECWYREFLKYVITPHHAKALLRDGGLADERTRASFRRFVRRFARRHPLRALRLPIR